MIRVVIADDHAVVRAGVRALLASTPEIEVVGEFSNGEDVLRTATDLAPDVVVLDLSMDGLDGLETTRRLLRRPSPPKVLALTMHEEADYLIPALEAGVSGYIVKSAAGSDLLDAVRTVARGRTWVSPSAAPILARGVARRAAQGDVRAAYEALSDREREVFRLIAQGHSATRVGALLHVSPKTVDTYRRRVNEKLGTSERADWVRLALELGVLTPESP